MAVKKGQKVVDATVLPLACITFTLENAALPINSAWFRETKTKDKWLARVGSIDSTHPNVFTAMQGDHRSLVMLVLRLPPGRYTFEGLEFEGRNRSFFMKYPRKGMNFFFSVKPNCVNLLGSMVIAGEWSQFNRSGQSIPMSMAIELTSSRDKKWVSDMVPGMAGLPMEESLIEIEDTSAATHTSASDDRP